ncbi:MAG: glycosyltransferase [Gammaproteobacteria bacterium]|nr:glycosyltransferase [Gammaproteobacteria bacterium]
MTVSIQVPVIKGRWLRQCVASVLDQDSPDFHLNLLWDQGDEESRRILEDLRDRADPRVRVAFSDKRLGVAGARRALSEMTEGEYILALDDDDLLDPSAVRRLQQIAAQQPWAGIVRARRRFVDEAGNTRPEKDWFPFQPRRYHRGMTCDVFNHSQPALLRSEIYSRTTGWSGFAEFQGAGEDCDIFLQMEEHADIELLDDCLYSYRHNPQRTSHELGPASAFEMWRRLADATMARRQLGLQRVGEKPPFRWEPLPRKRGPGAPLDLPLVPAPDLVDRVRRENADWLLLGADGIRPGAPIEKAITLLSENEADLGVLSHKPDPAQSITLPQPFAGIPAGRFSSSTHGLLLVRREVVSAGAVPDSGVSAADALLLDWQLKATRRGFRCLQLQFPLSGEPAAADRSAILQVLNRWGLRTVSPES